MFQKWNLRPRSSTKDQDGRDSSGVQKKQRSNNIRRSRATRPRQKATSSIKGPPRPLIFTIGHGTRTLSELIKLLQSVNITKLIDIRSIPRSRTNPQFNQDTLQSSPELQEAQIEYIGFAPTLGGRRNAKQPDIEQHTAIRVTAFRNYAGYMCTPSFREGLTELKNLAEDLQNSDAAYVAIMCSETLWWRCHRRMISDALVTQSWVVKHLGVGKEPAEHKRWDIARVDEEQNLVYDVA